MTFNSEKARMLRTFSWTFWRMLSLPYSPLIVSQSIVSTVVTLCRRKERQKIFDSFEIWTLELWHVKPKHSPLHHDNICESRVSDLGFQCQQSCNLILACFFMQITIWGPHRSRGAVIGETWETWILGIELSFSKM